VCAPLAQLPFAQHHDPDGGHQQQHRDDLKGPVLFNYWAWNNRESWLAMLNPLTWLDLLWNEMYWGRLGMTYDCRD